MSLDALSESATLSVYKYLEQRTLNLVTPDVFLILTDRASLRRAVCKKSLISLICFGCVGVKHTSHRQSPPPTTNIIIVHPRARDDPNHAHVLVHPFASTRSRRPRREPEETRARTDRFHRDRSTPPCRSRRRAPSPRPHAPSSIREALTTRTTHPSTRPASSPPRRHPLDSERIVRDRPPSLPSPDPRARTHHRRHSIDRAP